MKAISYDSYGGIDVMRLTEAETEPPPPTHDEVRVRVAAVSINPIDSKIRRGELKLMAGSHFPKRPGQDLSGVVVAVGRDVDGLRAGDEIYGFGRGMKEGALAEIVNVPAETIQKKPSSLDLATAAGVPVVALAALQALRDVSQVKPGMRVLVNGATGGVGLYAIQLAKRAGAHVTAVCGTSGVGLAKELGADLVVDYRKEDISKSGQTFDVLLELSGRMPFDQAHAILSEHGVYVDPSPTPASLVGNTLANPFRSHKHKFLMTSPRKADLDEVARLIDQGTLRVAPTKTFSWKSFREAFELAEKGAFIGKIALVVD